MGGGSQENQYEIPSSNAVELEESSGVSREGAPRVLEHLLRP